MEEALIKKIPPHSTEAEKSVIGSMLMSRDAVIAAAEILNKEDFYEQQYGVLFEAMKELNDEGHPVDVITLKNRLEAKGLPQEFTSLDYVRELLSSVPTSANVRYYAEIVSEKAQLRRLIRAAEEIAGDCYVGKDETASIMDKAEKNIFSVVQQRSGDNFVPIREVVLDALTAIENASKAKGSVTGLATGYPDLDYKTSGFQNSDLILVAARPSMGKTAFVLNIAAYMAFRKNIPAAIFSLEMSKGQLMNRLFALESRVNSQNIRTGHLSDEEDHFHRLSAADGGQRKERRQPSAGDLGYLAGPEITGP